MGHVRRRAVCACLLAIGLVVGALLLPSSGTASADPAPSGRSALETLSAAARVDPGEEAPHDHGAHDHGDLAQNSIVSAAHTASHRAAADPAAADDATAASPTLPPGFSDVEVITGVSEATSVAFAPDGTAFVALKTGLIKSFDYDSATGTFEDLADTTDFADLRRPVQNYWDRGLTGITVDPQFGTANHNYVYVSYTYNKDPRGGSVPAWGDPAEAYDQCEAPATTDPPAAGCPAMMRVSRLAATEGASGWVMSGTEEPLLTAGCFQFGSHASGDVVFGPDGKLYASAGEGASFDTLDHGQYADPCPGDPANEGGSLRSQDYRTPGDALDIDGSIVRIDPATGLTPSQSTAGQWLVAYGQRNPWRLVFRPGTDQLWSGDVGGSSWEEINRLDHAPTSATPVNRGWPCYEGSLDGSVRNEGWEAKGTQICTDLYAAGTSAVSAPYFSYQTRGPKLTTGEDCQNSTSSVSGVAFTTTASNYPAAYENALYFSDFARTCVWRLGKKANGDPDPTSITPFVQSAQTPVNLKVGPGGDLYYVDYGLLPNGELDVGKAGVHRIVYSGSDNAAPTAKIAADALSGTAPLKVTFDGTTSTDPDGDPLTYAWDLDGDGAYDDSTAAKPTHTFAAGNHTVGLTVADDHGHTSTASATVQAGNTAPVLGTTTPSGSLTWAVGDRIQFSGTATDAQDGPLEASQLSWSLVIRHCPGTVCHTHPLGSYAGVASGSFLAPDHENPSHLLLTVTATDSGGLTASRTVQLDPRTVDLTWASTPGAATVAVNSATHATPYTETFIQGSRLTMTAAPTLDGAPFAAWSDGGARTREVSAPTTATTYTALYAVNTPPTVTRVTTYPAGGFHVGQVLGFDASATDAQQDVPDSAWSFVMERQDCESGCPRQVVQRWSGVQNGQFVVPAVPWPSHLLLTATATDAQGASGSRTIRIDPQVAALTVRTRTGLTVGVDGVATRGAVTRVVGSTVRLTAPKRQKVKGQRWVFVRWSDGGARTHDVVVPAGGLTVKAVYRRVRAGGGRG